MSGEPEVVQAAPEAGPTAKVCICIPAGDELKTYFAYDWARMVGWTALNLAKQIEVKMMIAKGSLIPRQRESLVDAVLQHEDITHILFLDSDMRFPKNLIPRLLNHHAPAVCAGYVERGAPFRPVAFGDSKRYGIRVWTKPENTGTQRIAACGFGIMMLETQMIREKLEKPYFMVGWNPATASDGKVAGHMGEDIYFCLKLEEAGVPLLLDHDLTKEVAHLGEFAYMQQHSLQYLELHPELDLAKQERRIIQLP